MTGTINPNAAKNMPVTESPIPVHTLWSAILVERCATANDSATSPTSRPMITTSAASIVALQTSGKQLADVDGLHGGAEAFLTLANLLVALGFSQAARQHLPPESTSADPMNKS